ncbi:hypothetical protein M8J77_017551 [Diaphorina citri]|nr:hypothetical protein M8J77_017551 [Diaphorina citri]
MTNRAQYSRSLSSPEGFFNFLPTSYIARPPRLHNRRSMATNQSIDNESTPVPVSEGTTSQSVSSGLSLVPRLVDHNSLRASWNSVVQETLNAMTRVRNVDPTPARRPMSMTSWLHSRSHHRPSILSATSIPSPNAEHPMSPSGEIASQQPADANQVVLDLQYIDQNSNEDIIQLHNSNARPVLTSLHSVTGGGGSSPQTPSAVDDQPVRRASAGNLPGPSSSIPLPPPPDPASPSSPDQEAASPPGGATPAGEESTAEILRQNPEATAFLLGFFKYLPFVIILLAKAFYDHIYGIFLFVALFATFRFYNVLVKRSASQADQQTNLPLLFGVVHLMVTIAVFYLIYNKDQLYKVLIFVPPNNDLLKNLVQLIWIIIISDFIIKLCTIIVKILLTLLPAIILPTTKRGKWYLFIELTSQFYRSLVPIQLWLIYLMESYQGHQKVVGVFLSAAYIVAKGSNIMQAAKAWWKSFTKLLNNIQLGVSPTKETLLGVGCICPICHDEFKTPVQLTCCHIFCESCVTKWFDREQTCPLCRATLVDDPAWRDGATSYFVQIF